MRECLSFYPSQFKLKKKFRFNPNIDNTYVRTVHKIDAHVYTK